MRGVRPLPTSGRRPALGLVGILLLGVALAVLGIVSRSEPTLIGTYLGGRPAPDFTLTDHRGRAVSLSDVRSRIVVLTFIYTRCPDVCPILARNLRVAYDLLPEEVRDNVAFLAITVDPTRDTQQALTEFTATHGWADNPNWFALRGEPAALEQVWRAYGIYPGRHLGTPEGLSTPAAGGGAGHTDAIYLIDPDGREQIFLRSSATPQEITGAITALWH